MPKKVPAVVYSRVCGYFAPVNERFNAGKVQEYEERQNFDEVKSKESLRANPGKRPLGGPAPKDMSPEERKSFNTLFVYGAEKCYGCQQLKKELAEADIPFVYRDAFENKGELALLGVTALPIVCYRMNVFENCSFADVQNVLKEE